MYMIIVHLTKFLRHGPYNRPVNGTLSHGNKMSVPSSTRLTTANQLALNVRSAKKANSGLLRRNLASGKLEDPDSRSLLRSNYSGSVRVEQLLSAFYCCYCCFFQVEFRCCSVWNIYCRYVYFFATLNIVLILDNNQFGNLMISRYCGGGKIERWYDSTSIFSW